MPRDTVVALASQLTRADTRMYKLNSQLAGSAASGGKSSLFRAQSQRHNILKRLSYGYSIIQMIIPKPPS
jgi:hypothetical protein